MYAVTSSAEERRVDWLLRHLWFQPQQQVDYTRSPT